MKVGRGWNVNETLDTKQSNSIYARGEYEKKERKIQNTKAYVQNRTEGKARCGVG